MARARGGKSKRQFIIESIEPRVLLSKTIYVDANAGGTTHDGTSWENAFVDLQQALAIDAAGDEIRVAGGTYKPTSTADRAASFVLESGVKIYGGYAGSGASNPDQRDIALFPSVLSGDIGTVGDKLDNISTLVIVDGVDSSTRLDGFTLTSAFGRSYGGAIRNVGGSPIIANCSFVMNYAFSGGAMYNQGGSPQLENCTFLNNGDNYYGSMGGALANDSATLALSNCTFDGNTSGEGYGGAFYNKNSSLAITGITFKNNFGCEGAAMYNDSSVIEIDQAVIAGDLCNVASHLGVSDSSFSGAGSGIWNQVGSSADLSNCTFSGCRGGSYGVIENFGQGPNSLVLTDCVFTGNKSTAVYGSVNATRCQFIKNLAGAVSGGGQFTDCIFDGNSGTYGAAIFGGGTLVGCKFYRNSATELGGAIMGGLNATNCVFVGNSAPRGGAISLYSGDAVLTNCTFAENSATTGGRALDSDSATVTLSNVVMWDSTATTVPLVVTPTSNLHVSYCDIQAAYYYGSNSIYSDPLFVRTPSAGKDGKWGTADDDLGDLHLSQVKASPAIDAGSNALVPAGVTTDLAGNSRFIDAPGLRDPGAIVDMGAYETVPSLQALAGGPYTAVQGEQFQLNGFGCSNVAGELTFEWEISGDGLFDDVSGANALCPVAVLPVGVSAITLRVTDASGSSVTSTASITVLPATIIYVDARATGANTGTSWNDAYTDLAAAVAGATAGSVIRVAGGTYKPTTTTDRKLSFTLKSLISVHGGFAGIGAADPNRRDLAKYPTILSGDIGVVGDMNDNSMSVLFAGYVESTAILDGITITGGRSNGTGAGVYIAGSPTFLNCRFLGNSGGALQLSALNAASTPNIVNCVFAGNMSTRGGAVYIASATLATFTNCTFTANTATMSGGAIYGTSPTLVNCILWGNTAPVDPQIHPIGHAATVLYSDVQGGASGAANIDADPGFVRLPSSGFDSVWCTADDDYGDLRLTLSSPCIDAGSNLHVPSGTSVDVAGNTRLSDVVGVRDPGPIVDMGAYERVAPFADGAFPTDAPKPSVKITFNSDVLVSSLSSSDLMLVNCDTGAPIDCGAASVVSYDGAKRAATWQFLSVLPDGNYKATLPAGNVLDTNGGPIITTDLKFDFFVLAGDANRDRKVDINDLAILAANWQGSGKVFSQGDFSYDGKVDAADLGILSTHWQQALPPPLAAAPVSITRAPTRTPVRMVSVVG